MSRTTIIGLCVAALAVGVTVFVVTGGEDDNPGPATADAGHIERPDRPNILLITIDTLRADHVSAYGYSRDTTPFVDELADEGVLFTRAYSTSSWTVPAVVSLLTGTYPSAHGVVHGQVEEGKVKGQEAIPPELPSLPERLQEAGYRTFGITANTHLARPLGFDRGFDRYVCTGFAPARRVRGRFSRMLSSIRTGDDPWFVWIHLFDPHMPYRAREPFLSEIWPPDRPRFEELSAMRVAQEHSEGITGDRLDYLTALYDSEIHFADLVLREMVTDLGYDDALVIVASDHGEELKDHGALGHGRTLYEDSVRIPLIVRLPGGREGGQVVDEPVSLVDVMPTLLARLGIERPQGLHGRDIWPGEESSDRPLIMELDRGGRMRAIVDGDLKLIRSPGPEIFLFDVASDPAEANDLTASHASDTSRLGARLTEVLQGIERETPPAIVDIPEEDAERLRALGYTQ